MDWEYEKVKNPIWEDLRVFLPFFQELLLLTFKNLEAPNTLQKPHVCKVLILDLTNNIF